MAQDIKQQVTEARRSEKRNYAGRPRMTSGKRGVAGGYKSNVRKKHQKPLKHELPASAKHQMRQKMYDSREQFSKEDEMLQHWAKQFKMQMRALREIYHKRSEWQTLVKKHRHSVSEDQRSGRALATGVHGSGKQHVIRKRAEGAGAKKEFPEVFDKVKAWFESERCHGHQVLQRHLGWKYEEYMHQELAGGLTHKLEHEEHTKHESTHFQQKISKAETQIESMKKPKGLDKKAQRLVNQLGAKIRTPNLITQLHPVDCRGTSQS